MANLSFYTDESKNFHVIELAENHTVHKKRYQTFQTQKFTTEAAALAYFNQLQTEFEHEKFKKNPIRQTVLPAQFASDELIVKTFDTILQNEDILSVAPFLAKLDAKQSITFRTALKAFRKSYNESVDDERVWITKGSDLQLGIIDLAGLGVMTKSEIKSWSSLFVLLQSNQLSFVHAVIAQTKPSWLGEFIFERNLKEEWRSFDYDNLRALETQGFIRFNAENTVKSLSDISFWEYKSCAEKTILFDDPLSYGRDIPLLFDYPGNYANKIEPPIEGKKNEKTWVKIFLKLIADGKLDRFTALHKSFENQLKNWNNNQLQFFRQLIEALQPTPSELIQLQPQLFALLPVSNKIIGNFAVKEIRKIAFEPHFDKAEFVSWTSAIINNFEMKTSTKMILGIFEKYAKTNPELLPEILRSTVDVFMISDYELQHKAAGLVKKYANKNHSEITAGLYQYKPQMVGDIYAGLAFLFEDFDAEPELNPAEDWPANSVDEIAQKTPIKPIENWNDFLYAIGNAVNSGNPIDMEMVINAFLTKRHLLPPTYKKDLEIYRKPMGDTWKGSVGYFDLTFLLNVIFHDDIANLPFGKDYTDNKLLAIRKHIVAYSFAHYKKNYHLPLLSFPTHEPCFVDANVLIKRIMAYEKQRVKINPYDWMIALNRMDREADSETDKLLEQLPEAYRMMIQILIERDDEKASDYTQKMISKFKMGAKNSVLDTVALWVGKYLKGAERVLDPMIYDHQYVNGKSLFDAALMVSRLRFRDGKPADIGNFHQNIAFAEKNFEPDLSYQNITYQYKEYGSTQWKSAVKTEFHADFPKANTLHYFYYAYPIGKSKTRFDHYFDYAYDYGGGMDVYDLKTALSLMPYFPEPVFAGAFNSEYRTSGKFSEVNSTEMLRTMLEPHFQFGHFSLWYLACSQFADKKEVRLFSTEVLIHHLESDKLSIDALMQRIEILHQGKYGSIQRFIDNLNMLRDISDKHNAGLSEIIEKLLIDFSKEDKPPTNTKKILELLFDAKSKLKRQITPELRPILTKWQSNATLKKMADNLLKL